MKNIRADHISTFFEKWAPQSTRMEYDNVGLLTGSKNKIIERVLTCLDVTEAVVDEAVRFKADMIIAHHPVIFRKLDRIDPDSMQGNILYKLIAHDIAVLAVHTNLDAARDGVSFVMAQKIALRDTDFLKKEENQAADSGFGVIGELENPLDRESFLSHVKSGLGCSVIRYSGSADPVKKVAVCGGSGSALTAEAMKAGADAFITADVKYHDFFAGDSGFMLLDAGHYESESPIVDVMRDYLKNEFTSLNIQSTLINTNPINTYT